MTWYLLQYYYGNCTATHCGCVIQLFKFTHIYMWCSAELWWCAVVLCVASYFHSIQQFSSFFSIYLFTIDTTKGFFFVPLFCRLFDHILCASMDNHTQSLLVPLLNWNGWCWLCIECNGRIAWLTQSRNSIGYRLLLHIYTCLLYWRCFTMQSCTTHFSSLRSLILFRTIL